MVSTSMNTPAFSWNCCQPWPGGVRPAEILCVGIVFHLLPHVPKRGDRWRVQYGSNESPMNIAVVLMVFPRPPHPATYSSRGALEKGRVSHQPAGFLRQDSPAAFEVERKTSRSSRNRLFGAKERWVNRSACRCSLQGSYVTRFGRRARRHLR